jgi:hypothetical protein
VFDQYDMQHEQDMMELLIPANLDERKVDCAQDCAAWHEYHYEAEMNDRVETFTGYNGVSFTTQQLMSWQYNGTHHNQEPYVWNNKTHCNRNVVIRAHVVTMMGVHQMENVNDHYCAFYNEHGNDELHGMPRSLKAKKSLNERKRSLRKLSRTVPHKKYRHTRKLKKNRREERKLKEERELKQEAKFRRGKNL